LYKKYQEEIVRTVLKIPHEVWTRNISIIKNYDPKNIVDIPRELRDEITWYNHSRYIMTEKVRFNWDADSQHPFRITLEKDKHLKL
jgi:hypothetical protein